MLSSRSHRRRTSAVRAVIAACAVFSSPAIVASARADAAGAAPAPAPIVAAASAQAAQCAPIIVYANRGSSENLTARQPQAYGATEADGITPLTKYFSGLGAVMQPFYTQFRDDYVPGGVELVTNRAPQSTGGAAGATDPNGPATLGYRALGFTVSKIGAFADYRAAVSEGVAAAVHDLTTIHTRCPQSKLLVIGYSEGSEVTRRAVAQLPWTPDAGQAFVLLFGDVLYKPGELGVHFVGDTARDQKGAFRAAWEGDLGITSWFKSLSGPIPVWPAGWDVTSYCHGGDAACQYRGGTMIAHATYGTEDGFGAANRMATQLGGDFARPVVSARITNGGQCYPMGKRLGVRITVGDSAAATAPIKVTSQWEPSPFLPFNTVSVGAKAPAVSRNFYSGLFHRLVIWQDGHKLDYRNAC